MNQISKHNELSYELVNKLEDVLLAGEYATWEDLCVSVPVPGHPGYGFIVWGEEHKNRGKEFSVSLCKHFSEGPHKVIFTAYAPRDNAYEGLLDCADKVVSHFENSVKKPVEPLHPSSPYAAYTQKTMQPLLDALNEGNFELAVALTPAKYRLCGYQEFTSDYLYEQYGIGWAGQFTHTLVPAGRYPVFAENYHYHEADEQFTNQLKDFRGLSIFLAGQCVADSDRNKPEDYPYDNTVWSSPYCHAVANDILENNSSIHLLPQFQAKPVHFTYNGETHTTYKIVDLTLPDRMKHNPMELRKQNFYIHKTMDLSDNARILYDKFIHEYSYSVRGWFNAYITLDALDGRDRFSPEALKELMDKNLIQRRDCKEVSFELTAKERLHMFAVGDVHFAEQEPLKWRSALEKCEKEAAFKQPLSDKILEASSKAGVRQHLDVDEKNKCSSQLEL